ncbi:MAG: hypothetical protein IJU30_04815 [Lachnospiraceae bacterium]|nr:hypothetical protein [Lachnospiraceae bacterium]
MAPRRSYSPRKLGTMLDTAHIVIGVLVVIMAVFTVLDPMKYKFLFPVIFFLAAALTLITSWFMFTAYKRNSKKKIAGIIYLIVGLLLLGLFVISAISIWVHG